MSSFETKVQEARANPRNQGEIQDADAMGTVGSPECGDMLRIYGVIIWGHCSRIHKKLVRLEEAGQFPAWHDYPGSNILERFTM